MWNKASKLRLQVHKPDEFANLCQTCTAKAHLAIKTPMYVPIGNCGILSLVAIIRQPRRKLALRKPCEVAL